MPHIAQSRHGIWKYRRGIPESLRPFMGKREIVVSLGPKGERAAELRSLTACQEAEGLLTAWKAQAAGVARPVTGVVSEERSAIEDWYCGLDFHSAHGFAYRSCRKGIQDDVEFAIQESIVHEQLGIDTDVPDTRKGHLCAAPRPKRS